MVGTCTDDVFSHCSGQSLSHKPVDQGAINYAGKFSEKNKPALTDVHYE